MTGWEGQERREYPTPLCFAIHEDLKQEISDIRILHQNLDAGVRTLLSKQEVIFQMIQAKEEREILVKMGKRLATLLVGLAALMVAWEKIVQYTGSYLR